MKEITLDLINQLSLDAINSTRRRLNYNFHTKDNDPIQRMLNAFEPLTYIRPHRHFELHKREVFIILRGRLLVIYFDDNGKMTKTTELSHISNNLAVEIEPHEWHTVISLESGTVVYEIKDGPYDVISDKQFALWAPDENDPNSANYVSELLKIINHQSNN